MNYRINPPDELIEASITMPLSKSLSNRALIINALTPGSTPIEAVADCDDTSVLKQALTSTADTIDIGAAGTAMRFLTAYFAVQQGRTVTLDGSERMRQRPIGPLVDALRQCGASIEYMGQDGFPPLRITGRQLHGGALTVPASISSQYISALLMTAPLMQQGLQLNLDGDVTSRPYIDMTVSLMRQAGATVEMPASASYISVAPGAYSPVDFYIEGDWSAASYWYEIAAMSSGFIDLKGLHPRSLQGDSKVSRLFEVFGLKSEFTDDDTLELQPTPDPGARLIADLADTPDLAQTLAVTCCMLAIPFRFTGLASLKIKETDRLAALCDELLKFGYLLRVEDDSTLMWEGIRFPVENISSIDTYHDHRMAMAFAPVAIFVPGLTINNAEVVTKSYPDFWNDMQKAGFTIEEV